LQHSTGSSISVANSRVVAFAYLPGQRRCCGEQSGRLSQFTPLFGRQLALPPPSPGRSTPRLPAPEILPGCILPGHDVREDARARPFHGSTGTGPRLGQDQLSGAGTRGHRRAIERDHRSRCAGEGGVRLSDIGFEQRCQLLLHFPFLGEAASFRFGEEIAIAQGDLEDATATGNEGDSVGEVFCVIVKDVFRQPGGFLDVPSRGAVLNPDRGGRCGLGHRSLLPL
jgi:hypothetical protein